MKREYISAEISIVTISHKDIIATSNQLESNSMGLRMYNDGINNTDGVIGIGED